MKRLIAVLLALMLPASAMAASYCECPSPEAHAQRQERFERTLYAYQTMGAQVALIQNGRVVDTFAYGRANRAEGTPVTPDTYFRVASVTKMVTAMGVMRLVERDILSLDGDISDAFGFTVRNPYFPKTPITLRQIMSHSATLHDGYHYAQALNGNIVSLETVFTGRHARENFMGKEPGTVTAYSNFGGGLLGSLIEEHGGMTIDEYMQHYIFLPLGFYAAYHTPNLPYDAQIARIYNPESTGMTLDPMSFTDTHYDPEPLLDYTHTAGGLSITADGLAKLLIVLAGDGTYDGVKILEPETVEMMRTAQNNIGSVSCETNRGLNHNIITVSDRTMYGHQGKAYGAISAAYYDPITQTGVALVTNGCDDSTVNTVARIARAIIALALDELL